MLERENPTRTEGERDAITVVREDCAQESVILDLNEMRDRATQRQGVDISGGGKNRAKVVWLGVWRTRETKRGGLRTQICSITYSLISCGKESGFLWSVLNIT